MRLCGVVPPWVLAATLLFATSGTGQPEQASAPLSCFVMLQQSGEVDDNLATQLCQGAQSTAPAQCFLLIEQAGDLSLPQAVQLCQYASPSDDPAGCYLQARDQTFLEPSRIIRLCQPAVSLYCPRGL